MTEHRGPCDPGGMPSTCIRVSPDHRGGWNVLPPSDQDRVTCATLDEARRVAHAWAMRSQPCELIVRDAYDRVLQYEVVETAREAAGCS